MKNINPKISWFGIALILVGGMLLLDRFHILHLAFSTVFWPIIMILTLIGVGQGFAQSRRGKIFWNTVWFLYALFFFLRNSEFVELRSHMLMPATFFPFSCPLWPHLEFAAIRRQRLDTTRRRGSSRRWHRKVRLPARTRRNERRSSLGEKLRFRRSWCLFS